MGERFHNVVAFILFCIVFIYEKCNCATSCGGAARYCFWRNNFIFFYVIFL